MCICTLYLCCSALETPSHQVLHGQAPLFYFVFVFLSIFFLTVCFLQVNVILMRKLKCLELEPIIGPMEITCISYGDRYILPRPVRGPDAQERMCSLDPP